jgi:hypothetical protein
MKHKNSYKPAYLFLILMAFTFVTYGQQITLIDFGVDAQITPGNWNNFTFQNRLGTAINLNDNTGASTGATLTLTDVFDRNFRNNEGTRFPVVTFGGLPLPRTASRDSFFGESKIFNGSTETTGGFTLSGLEVGNSYSFRVFASRMTNVPLNEPIYNRETLYTITGNTVAKTATLDAADNITNVATVVYIQPNSRGEITIQATTGPNNNEPNGFYYIGAIEITKTCLSTVTWNGIAWLPSAPTSSTAAVINGNYTTSATTNITACSLTVNAGFSLNIIDNTFVYVETDVTVNGNITVENHGTFKQNNNLSAFTLGVGGTSVVRKTTSVLNNWYDYTYWSSPVSGLTIATSPLVDSDMRYWYKAANFLDVKTERGNTGVFDLGSDDIDDNGDDWQFAYNAIPMDAGVGFAATHSRIGYRGALAYGYDFTGPFHNGIYTTGIAYNGDNGDKDWNLIGNPYPGALDFNAFYLENSGVVDGAAYLWSHRTDISPTASGNQAFNFSQNDYKIIAAGSGSVNNFDNGDGVKPNDYIPSGQGFFISGLANGPVTFKNSMRMADMTSNSQFFKNSNSKNKSTAVANKLWINLTSDNGIFNQVLVAYVDGATNGNDGMAYDATRNLSSGVASIIYTLIDGATNNKYAIQGKSVSSLNSDEIIPLGFYTSITSATIYKFSLAFIQGDFLTGSPIYLIDNLLNKVHNLSASDYMFTSAVGEFNSRFEIAFTNKTLSLNEVQLNTKAFKIVELQDDLVQFNTNNNLTIKAVNIYDLLGRELYRFKGENTSETYRLSNLNNTVYIAKVTLSDGTLVTKKAVKK